MKVPEDPEVPQMETDYTLTLEPGTPILELFMVGSGISNYYIVFQLTSRVFSGLEFDPSPIP